MVYCNIRGGLGNLMFQIAATKCIGLLNGMDFSIPNLHDYLIVLNNHHNNKQLTYAEDYFYFFNDVKTEEPRVPNLKNYAYPFHYQDIKINDDNFLVNGFFQSEKYFYGFNDEVKKLFKLKDEIMDGLVLKYSDLLNIKNKTSIHVRRGDYLQFQDHHPVQDIEYYNKAIQMVEDKTDMFVVFSDDINWCKNNIKADKITFIENELDYIELFLMSLCENNIICNSSFSWWGAWLNNNENKIVIAPNKWFGKAISEKDCDIIPNTWLKI